MENLQQHPIAGHVARSDSRITSIRIPRCYTRRRRHAPWTGHQLERKSTAEEQQGSAAVHRKCVRYATCFRLLSRWNRNFRSTSVADGALYCSSYIDALAESVVGLECQASGTGVPMTISTLDSARPSPVWMKQIQVVMKDGVTFPTPTPTSSDPTSSSRRSGSAPASSTASNSAAPADTGSQGLSTGAIAGIAVGVTAVALILIAIAAFLLLRRRRQRGQTTTANNAGPSGVRWSSIPELAGSPRAEKYASTGTPLSHANYIAELPENRTVAELPGSK
jgi:hypothetical protein